MALLLQAPVGSSKIGVKSIQIFFLGQTHLRLCKKRQTLFRLLDSKSLISYQGLPNQNIVVLILGTVLCVLDSMCPCLYVSISLCVQGSMWQISCRIDPLWLWFYVSRVLCGPGSMWPLMYKLTLCVVGPMCPGSNVTNALCVQGSMCPWLYVAIVYMLLY